MGGMSDKDYHNIVDAIKDLKNKKVKVIRECQLAESYNLIFTKYGELPEVNKIPDAVL